ncbi:MAG: family 78 glycoside hydrolase catalytic domain [Acidimicrobiales bacterium]
MSDRIDRRAFLATGLKAGMVTSASGAMLQAPPELDRTARTGRRRRSVPTPDAPGPPTALTTNGVVEPTGVDPDDASFAWLIDDPRRGALQSRYEVAVFGPFPESRAVWRSGAVESARQAFVAYGGAPLLSDARYSWAVRTADRHGTWGPFSDVATFTTGLRPPDWIAHWLRPGPADPGLEEYTYLRRVVELAPGQVAFATATIAAAHKYQLWVNGTLVDTGPSFCFPDEQYYQATDVTDHLTAGRTNAIGILHHWYGPGRGRPASAPGLLAQLSVRYEDGRVIRLGSDGSWRTRRAEWLPAPQRNNDGGDFVEWIDARDTPEGWSDPTYDDRGWTAADVLGPVGTQPFTKLFAQRTRIVEEPVRALSVRTLPTGSVVADFGKVYAGRPSVVFHRGTDGHTVPMHVGYTLDGDGSVSTIHNTQATDLSYSLIQREGRLTFEPFWYLGFRYLQIDDPGETIGKDQVALLARHAAMPERPAATFASSDTTLDAVWAMCAHSGLFTSQEQFVDTPTREKGQFLWDAANESQTVMQAYGEQNLTWQGLRDMARAQVRYWSATGQVNEIYPNDDGAQNFPLFTGLYPEWVWRYYLSTGDTVTVIGLLPTLTRLSGYLSSTIDSATGLMTGLPKSTNSDYQYGYDYDTVADTTLNILAVNAFRRIGQVAALAGDTGAASDFEGRSARLAASINSLLITPSKLYCDGLKATGEQSSVSSQLANVAALAYGVAPAPYAPAIASYVATLDISVQPDHGMELLRALAAGGRTTDVVRLLTDGSFPGWADILRQDGTFTWETWRPSDLIGDSMSHGWGSSALVAVQETLLGVTSGLSPAGGPQPVIRLEPFNGGLEHVEGTVPTVAGGLAVAWRIEDQGRRLTVAVPPNAGVACLLPGVRPDQVTESGSPLVRAEGVTVDDSAAGRLVVNLAAGRYDLSITELGTGRMVRTGEGAPG